MKAILNDVDNSFEGRLEVVDAAESKGDFCRLLGCRRCLKTWISVEGCRFGLVYPEERENRGWPSISCVNTGGDPDFDGSYLLFGLSDSGKLTGLSGDEVELLMSHFGLDKYEDGRGKYCLWGVDI